MPDEELKLTDEELATLQRLADAKQMTMDDVLETIAVNALMAYPREEQTQ